MVPMDRDPGKLAPGFWTRIQAVVATLQGWGLDPWVVECVRTKERQAWLYAQGRTRSGAVVTKAQSHLQSWHGHGLAVDIVSRSLHWNAPPSFWTALGKACRAHGVTWGGDWKNFPDRPHCQDARVPVGPKAADKVRTAGQGMAATWAAYGVA
jgi:peptidoglycan L-alanyl-D-glutamate endopeptidase CwlK